MLVRFYLECGFAGWARALCDEPQLVCGLGGWDDGGNLLRLGEVGAVAVGGVVGVQEGFVGGVQEGAVGGVFAELPDHEAADVVVEGKVGFGADGGGVFVGPEGVAVEEPGGLRGGVAVDGGAGGEGLDVAVGAVAVDGSALLEEAVGGGGDLAPAVAVEGDADEELRCEDACGTEVGNGVLDRACVAFRCGGKRRDEAGVVHPWPGEVVGHQADLVGDAADGGEVEAFDHARAGTDGDGEDHAGADGVHALAEFGCEGEEVGGIVGVRVLPVDVDAVEEAGCVDARGEMAFEEEVDAGVEKGLAVLGLGVVGEVGGLAFERENELEVRVAALEEGELVEVATERLIGAVSVAVDALGGFEGSVEIGVRVGDRAAAVGDEALSVVELVEHSRAAGGDEIFYEVAGFVVEAPLAEVADELGADGLLGGFGA